MRNFAIAALIVALCGPAFTAKADYDHPQSADIELSESFQMDLVAPAEAESVLGVHLASLEGLSDVHAYASAIQDCDGCHSVRLEKLKSFTRLKLLNGRLTHLSDYGGNQDAAFSLRL